MLDFHNLECNVRSKTSVTVLSRLNAPTVLWRLNNLILPACMGLKLLTWQLESVVGLPSMRLTPAMYCPLCWWFMTFEMGFLAMWMMENRRFSSEHLFLVELSPCRKSHGIYRGQKSRPGQERFANLLFFFSLPSSGWKTEKKKKALNSA